MVNTFLGQLKHLVKGRSEVLCYTRDTLVTTLVFKRGLFPFAPLAQVTCFDHQIQLGSFVMG